MPSQRERQCEHHWYWRHRRSNDFGYWECPRCELRTPNVGLTPEGRAAQSAEEALAREGS